MEAYSGIIRNIWIEIGPSAYIANVRLAYRLSDGFSPAACQFQVFLNAKSDASGELIVSVRHDASEVSRTSAPATAHLGNPEIDITFNVDAPILDISGIGRDRLFRQIVWNESN